MDGCDGYTSSRRRINRGWDYAKVLNAVVLPRNVHRSWAIGPKVDFCHLPQLLSARTWSANNVPAAPTN